MDLFVRRVSGPAAWPAEQPDPEKETWKAAAAARAHELGVPWPPSEVVRAGRPTRDALYRRALWEVLENIATGAQPDRPLPAQPPPHWRPGMPVDTEAPPPVESEAKPDPPKMKAVGRPSFRALYQAERASAVDNDLLPAEPPAWWHPKHGPRIWEGPATESGELMAAKEEAAESTGKRGKQDYLFAWSLAYTTGNVCMDFSLCVRPFLHGI